MRGVVFPGNRKIEYLEVPDPTPGPLDVVIELKIDDWNARSAIAKATELLLSPWRPLF